MYQSQNPIIRVSLFLSLLACICGCQSSSNPPSPNIQPSREITGVENVINNLVSTFDHTDILALTDTHWRKADSDLRIALVRSPEFTKKVHLIVVEFATTAYQSVLDRYVAGEDVPLAELQQVWQKTTQTNGVWNSPLYADFFAAVRDTNKKLLPNHRLRVLAGDPPAGTDIRHGARDWSAISILKQQVLEKGEKALLIYGSGHLNRIGGITRELEATHPGHIFVVDILGGTDTSYQKFEHALKSPIRPAFISLHKFPFSNFSADEFLGGSQKLVNGTWVPAHEYQQFTLTQMADACVYLGTSPDITIRVPSTP